MSNIKAIRIVADVPWDWAGQLSEADAAQFASLLLNPVIGIKIRQERLGYEKNDNGGQTSMYRIELDGVEALSYPFLQRIARALAKLGRLWIAEACDTQWEDETNPWELILPRSEYYKRTKTGKPPKATKSGVLKAKDRI